MEETRAGYLVPLVDMGGGVGRVVDPSDLSQQLDVGYSDEDLRVVVVSDLSVIRRWSVRHWLSLASKGNLPIVEISPSEIQKWGLRPMDKVGLTRRNGGWIVSRVGNRTNPRDSQNRLHHENLALKKGMAVVPFPFTELEALNSSNTPMSEGQYKAIRDGGILTARALSALAPNLWGSATLIAGPSAGGKSFTMSMMYYLAAWKLIAEMPDLQIVFLDVGERGDELAGVLSVSEASDRIEVFGSEYGDPPDCSLTAAELAIARVKRLIEVGKAVLFFVDSCTRWAQAWQLGDPGGTLTTGGQSVRGLAEIRSGLGVVGTYPSHSARVRIRGWDSNWYESPPLCSVVCTCLTETGGRFDEVLYGLMSGTANVLWPFTKENDRHPKIDFSSLVARNLHYARSSNEEWPWFHKAAWARLHLVAKNGRRWNLTAGSEWLSRAFAPPLGEVMVLWREEEERNQIVAKYGFSPAATRVLISDWKLTASEVVTLVKAGVNSSELVEEIDLADLGESAIALAKGEGTGEDLRSALDSWRGQFDYLWALNQMNVERGSSARSAPLSSYYTAPLMRAGVTKGLFLDLLRAGFDTATIRRAVVSGTTVEQLRGWLNGHEAKEE